MVKVNSEEQIELFRNKISNMSIQDMISALTIIWCPSLAMKRKTMVITFENILVTVSILTLLSAILISQLNNELLILSFLALLISGLFQHSVHAWKKSEILLQETLINELERIYMEMSDVQQFAFKASYPCLVSKHFSVHQD